MRQTEADSGGENRKQGRSFGSDPVGLKRGKEENQPCQILSEVMSFSVAAPHMVIVLLSSPMILSI